MEVRDIQYKESQIGLIPNDWTVNKLSALSMDIGDGIHTTPKYVNDSEYYFINGNNLENGLIKCYDETKCVSNEEYELLKKNLNQRTILMSINGTIGNLAFFNNEKVILGKSAAYINLNDKVDKRFIYFLLQHSSIKNFYENELTGTTIRNLSLKSIRDTPIPLPPTKSEQTAIATALSDTDALIENLKKLIAKKRNIKQGVMQELLTGRKRLAGFSTEWRYSTLSKFVADKKFAIVDGPFGSQMKVQDFVEQGIPIVEMEHLKNKFLEPDKLDRYITHKKFEELIRSSVFPDDIIISKTGSLGYISIVPSSIEKALITSRLAKITLDKKKANISFVFQCLTRLREIEYWQRTAQGGTMLILSIANISHAPIPDISIYEQKEIADILDTMDNDIERLEQILYKYNMIKHGMMQALLTGKIRLI